MQIRAQELLKQAWLKSNKEQVAPNIVASIKRFNLVSNWITTEVLTVPGLRERVTTIEYFIRIAQVRHKGLLLLCRFDSALRYRSL